MIYFRKFLQNLAFAVNNISSQKMLILYSVIKFIELKLSFSNAIHKNKLSWKLNWFSDVSFKHHYIYKVHSNCVYKVNIYQLMKMNQGMTALPFGTWQRVCCHKFADIPLTRHQATWRTVKSSAAQHPQSRSPHNDILTPVYDPLTLLTFHNCHLVNLSRIWTCAFKSNTKIYIV
jgi:hypothetical protein